MSRNRQNNKNTVIFSFGVDKNDPKYADLIQFLDSIDSGARSYVIRQILNGYVKSQVGEPTIGLIGGGFNPAEQTTAPTNSTSPASEEIKQEKVEKTEEPVPDTSTPIEESKDVESEEQKPKPKPKKPKRDPRLDALKNTFG